MSLHFYAGLVEEKYSAGGMMKKYNLQIVLICISVFTIMLSGCGAHKEDGKTETAADNKTAYYVPDEELEFFAERLGLTDAEYLASWIRHLHERGCGKVQSIDIGEYDEYGLLHFTVTDTEGNIFYTRTNRHGEFGVILTQTGKDNADLLAETFRLSPTGNVLYTAGTLEELGCGAIDSIENISSDKAYSFTFINKDGKKYEMSMSSDGSIGWVRDGNGKGLYMPIE